MSFAQRELSRTKGQPVSLLLFRYGAAVDEFFAYTNAEYERTHATVNYQPVPISYGAIEASGSLDKKTLEVRTSLDNEVAELFRVSPPSYPISLVIRRGHLNDADNQFLVEWSGRVLSCARERNEAIFACEPISTSMRRTGLRRHWQYSCPHALYGPQCNANKAAATTTQTVVNVENAAIILNDGWEIPSRAVKAHGGIVEWTGPNGTIRRTVIAINDDLVTLRLNGPTTGLTSGSEVEVSLGCNLRFEHNGTSFVDTDCQTIHNNIQNYGGQPWIPDDNPIGTNVNKYY